MTHRERDFIRIARYLLATKDELITIQDITQIPNIEKFRVLPIIHQLYIKGRIEAVKCSFFGTPEEFRVKRANKKIL